MVHRPRLGTPWAVAASLVLARSLLGGDVRIHELFYHPPSELDREEWVELANTGAQPIDLSGWRFTEGVRFTFPPGTILAPGGFLVVAADLPSFQALHPGVTNVVGGWDGILSNSGQQLRLVDAAGKAADSVRYADDGEWAERVRDVVDYGHRGWKWASAADGGGRSLELRQVALPNGHGRNWSPSTVDGGTPGRANSTATTNLPPILADVRHRPLVPRSSEPVEVNAVIVDEAPSTNILATLHWRVDEAAAFNTVPMFDDGLHGDGAPGDGIVGGTVPPQANNAVVEFYVAATDPSGQTRTWPSPALDDGVPRQALNALYQVDDAQQAALPRPGELPRYRLVLLAADRAELESINRNSPAAPFPQPAPFNDPTRSHAQFNATFVSVDGTGAELRYLVGVRNRGNGSRTKLPQGLRLHLRNDDLWRQVSALNLNSQYTPAALLRIQTLIDDGALVWLNGHAIYRQNLNPASPAYADYAASTVSKATFNGPTDVPATWLLPGDNVLAVEVHQANASSSDVTFALRLFQQITSTNATGGAQSLVLNEVVARNDAFPEPNGALVDWVELHNPNPTALDIGGLALTDDPGQPDRFVFPAGTLVGGHGFVRVQLIAPSSGESPATNGPAAAFGLNADGDRLYLLDTAARARALLDSVSFGRLPRNLGLARVPDGSGPWTLSQPTPGSTNHAVALGNAAAITINEWMANPSSGDDWIELHNPGPLPVDLSGWHLTDNLTQPTKHRLPPNTFLGTGPDAYLLVQADGTAGVSAIHAPFKLDAKGESIGLATPDGVLVQSLSFGASGPGVSEGRFPDDAPAIARFPTLPTPGAANRADADRDGLPDDWEVANGLSPSVASDAWADLDGDGASNRLEWASGTDPRDPASVLALRHEATGAQGLAVSFVAVGGCSYVLQVAPTPEAATWDVGLRIPARPARRDIRATIPFAGDARFVRVVVE